MNPEPPTPSFPDDFETRLTALLLGELSGAEAEEVRRAVAADPGLQALQERLAQTIGLVRDAIGSPAAPATATGIAAPVPVRPKLSEARRERLLARLRQPAGTTGHAAPVGAPDAKTISMQAQSPNQSARRWSIPWYLPMSLAAAVVVLLTLNPLMDGFAPRTKLAMAPAADGSRFDRAGGGRSSGVDANDFALNVPSPTPAPAPREMAERVAGERGAEARKYQINGAVPNPVKLATPPVENFREVASSTLPATPLSAESKAPSAQARQLSLPESETARGRLKGKALADPAPAKADVSDGLARATPLSKNATVEDLAAAPAQNRGVQLGMEFGGRVAGRGGFGGGAGSSGGVGGADSYGGGAIASGNETTVRRGLAMPSGGSSSAPARDAAASPPSPVTGAIAGPGAAVDAGRVSVAADGRLNELAQQVAPPSAGVAIANGTAKPEWYFDTDTKDTKSAALKQLGTQAGLGGAPQPAEPAVANAFRFGADAEKRGEAFAVDRLQELERLERPQALPEVRFVAPADKAAHWDVADKAVQEQQVQLFAKAKAPATQPLGSLSAGKPASTTFFAELGDAAPAASAPIAAGAIDSNALGRRLERGAREELELKERVDETRAGIRPELSFRARAPIGQNTAQLAGEPAAVTNRPGDLPEILGKKVTLAAAAAPIPAPAPDAKVLALSTADDALAVAPRTPPPVPQPEVAAADNAFSTFSLNVTDVSFKLAAASLEKGVLPDPATIRTEEFINAFHYRDPEPAAGAPVGFAWERAQYPFAHNRELLRFAVRTSATGRDASRPLNLVLLLDNSGSMERADRVRIVREALRVLSAQLKPEDRISVVTFARQPRLWVDAAPGNEAGDLAERVGSLTPEGGTNLEEAMNLAYDTAARHFLAQGVNRVVLLTDGAANLGDVSAASLKGKVETWRKRGVALDCFGIGWEGLNDELLEALARNGDGRYGFVNTPEEASSGFAAQLAGALNVAAADVKVQVEFNPQRVTTWRQLGYAKHQLKKEQFRDNTVDAAELAAAESGNALYTAEVNANGSGPIATVRVRFREPATGTYREHAWEVPYSGAAVALDRAPARMRLAAVGSAFSEWLAGSPFAAEVEPGRLLNLLQGVSDEFGPDPAPQKLESMIRQARSLTGK